MLSATHKCLEHAWNGNIKHDCPDWVAEELDCKILKEANKMSRELPTEVRENLEAGEGLEFLDGKDKKNLKLFYIDNMKSTEIEKKLGYSRNYSSYKRSKAIDKCIEELGPEQRDENQEAAEDKNDTSETAEEESSSELENELPSEAKDVAPEEGLLKINGDSVEVYLKNAVKLKRILKDNGLDAELYVKL